MNHNRKKALVLSAICAAIWLISLVLFHVIKYRLAGSGTIAIPTGYAALAFILFYLIFVPLFHRIKYYASLAKMHFLKRISWFLLVVSYIGLPIGVIALLA